MNVTEIRGLSYQGAMWSLGLYFLLLGIQTRRICKVMAKDIRSGNVELKINKPINYLVFKISEYLGQIILDFIVIIIVTLCILILSVGLPNYDYTFIWALKVFLLFVFGITISILISVLIGILAFWVENIDPIYWVIDKGLMIFGGSYLPVAFFPPLIREMAEVLPFSAPVFVNQLFYDNFRTNSYKLLVVQVFWIVVLFFMTKLLFNKALKHLSVNGG
jgi:ABC-2 type transport system permease protein